MRFAAILLLWPALAYSAPPKLVIPPEVRPTGSYVTFVPDTDAKSVVYIGLSGEEPFPSALLKDPRAFALPVRGLTAGRYRFTAVAVLADEYTRQDFVAVVGDAPPVPPGPNPPTPPGPADPLAASLATAYAAEADPAKAQQVQLLAALWRQAGASTVNDAQYTTTAAILPVLHAAADTLVGAGGLPKVRRAVADELNKTMATPLPLDAALRAKLAAQFAHVAEVLGGLK